MTVFKGSGVAIITPFNENGINFPKFKELIEWQIAEGTDAIIVCGMSGVCWNWIRKKKCYQICS